MMHVLVSDAEESPYQFLFELADHAFEQPDVSRHLLSVITSAGLFDHIYDFLAQLFWILHPVYFNEVPYQSVSPSSLTFVGITGGYVDEEVVDVLLAFFLPAVFEEVRVPGHLYAALVQKTERLLKGVDEELVGDGIETGCHD